MSFALLSIVNRCKLRITHVPHHGFVIGKTQLRDVLMAIGNDLGVPSTRSSNICRDLLDDEAFLIPGTDSLRLDCVRQGLSDLGWPNPPPWADVLDALYNHHGVLRPLVAEAVFVS